MMRQVFLHNLKLSFRILSRSRIYTAINLSGLVLGLTASFILIIFAINELSFNSWFKNADSIYRLIVNDMKGNRQPLGPLNIKTSLIKSFPEIDKSFRIISLDNYYGAVDIRNNSQNIPVSKFYCADPEIFNSLKIKIISGRRSQALKHPFFVFISSDAAKRFFEKESPVGKDLEVNINGLIYNLLVEGVYENLPWNSTLKPDFICGIGLFTDIWLKSQQLAEPNESLENELMVETYIVIRQNGSIESINKRLPWFTTNYYSNAGLSFEFQNFTKIYLHSNDLQNDFIAKGSMQNIFIYLSLAFFILLLATINYSMLSTARSAMRFKEIGVRKVLGATRRNLRSQVLTESLLLTIIAFPLAFLILGLVAPVIQYYYSYEIFFVSSNAISYIAITAGITICIGILSGSYIAVYLSSLDPLTALKSNYYIYKKVSFSKIFIVFQFLITIALFISLLTIHEQIKLFLGQKNGINKENLIVLSLKQFDISQYQQVKKVLATSSHILSLTGISIALPTKDVSMTNLKLPGDKKKTVSFERLSIDHHFFETMGIDFVLGKDFNPNEQVVNAKSVIINEEALRQLEFRDPLQNTIGRFRIIGVVKDFNIHSLHKQINPAIFLFNPEAFQSLVIRFKAGKEEDVLDVIIRSWEGLTPNVPLEYKFFDEKLNELYIKEQNFGRVIGSFTFLAFVITGMGLFGLAMLIVERRMKEMTIRRVFGASPGIIIYLIQKEFIVFVIIAAAIAIPLAWYVLSLWLNEFYYRVSLQWHLFFLSVVAVGGFVSLILLMKTLRILRENPANVLKYE